MFVLNFDFLIDTNYRRITRGTLPEGLGEKVPPRYCGWVGHHPHQFSSPQAVQLSLAATLPWDWQLPHIKLSWAPYPTVACKLAIRISTVLLVVCN